MTTIAVKRTETEILLAADTQESFNSMCRPCSKIFKKRDYLIAYSGDMGIFHLLKYWKDLCLNNSGKDIQTYFLAFHAYLSSIDSGLKWSNPSDGTCESVILVKGNKIYEVNGFEVSLIKSYAVIGSGMSFAYIALDCGKSPAEAVKLASQYDIYTNDEIESYRFLLKKLKKTR